MAILENYKTVILPINFTTVTNKNAYVNVEFIPDEVVLKAVQIQMDGNDANGIDLFKYITISSSLINNEIMYVYVSRKSNFDGTVDDGDTLQLYTNDNINNTRWKISQPINNSYNFFLDTPTTEYTATNMNIILTLEFRKYKQQNSYSA